VTHFRRQKIQRMRHFLAGIVKAPGRLALRVSITSDEDAESWRPARDFARKAWNAATQEGRLEKKGALSTHKVRHLESRRFRKGDVSIVLQRVTERSLASGGLLTEFTTAELTDVRVNQFLDKADAAGAEMVETARLRGAHEGRGRGLEFVQRGAVSSRCRARSIEN